MSAATSRSGGSISRPPTSSPASTRGPTTPSRSAFYGLNAGLVFALVLSALRLFVPGGRSGGLTSWDAGAAALAAAWWAMHPLRVETTAWISGNLYGQSAALLLASLVAYLRTYRSAGAAARGVAVRGRGRVRGLASHLPGRAGGARSSWSASTGSYARENPGTRLRRLLAEKAVFLAPLAAVLAVTLAARVREHRGLRRRARDARAAPRKPGRAVGLRRGLLRLEALVAVPPLPALRHPDGLQSRRARRSS